MSASVLQPAVAGLFYPDDAATLSKDVDGFLARAEAAPPAEAPPVALVVPHAGYVYSGAVAGSAYALLSRHGARYRRAIILGPSHRLAFRGLAVPSAEHVRTPLGDIAIDVPLRTRALEREGVQMLDAAHTQEHSIEVQLPFLQRCLTDFTVLPLSVGDASTETVAGLLEAIWTEPDCLLVVSTDLSHFHPYPAAQAIDAETAAAIVECRGDLRPEQACGCRGLNGLLAVARRRGYTVHELARCNSGDTAGPRHRVVGYGAYRIDGSAPV